MQSFLRVTRIRVAAGAFAFVALFAVAAGVTSDLDRPVSPAGSVVANDIGWPGPAPAPTPTPGANTRILADGDIGWPAPPTV
ncbi:MULTISPECIES: hypothetical protein [Streptomyces]|uniref:hypothetical protein n=1 Tax=Streptomyces TaxID=1883 RepID=UPI000BEFA8D2|nr:hypothetical protein [Streptomyces sp. f150]